MADSPISKIQTRLEIKSTQPPPQRISTELTAEELLKEQRIPFPFFRRLSQRKENTWIISVFVILHLIAFAATMIVNDCWGNSHAQCALKQLGRFSFQRLSENPLLGPSASAWVSRFSVSIILNQYVIKWVGLEFVEVGLSLSVSTWLCIDWVTWIDV